MLMNKLAKRLFASVGLNVSRRDRLEEQIPADYPKSPFLPRVYRQSLGRLFYFRAMFERIAAVPGDIVECGVSTGHGILYWSLLCELTGQHRTVWGFDSFAGFPPSTEADRKADRSFYTQEHDYTSPPEMVMKVLSDGRVADEFVSTSVRLVKGYFEDSLSRYDGRIALLHLDCDLYESIRTCLDRLYDRVQPGGVIMIDEYDDPNFPGARQAVDEFFRDKPEKPVLYDQFQYPKHYVAKS